MRILLYEYATGGGLFGIPLDDELQSLLAEGAAMITALAADFATAGHNVQVLCDERMTGLHFPGCEIILVRARGDDERLLREFAGRADQTLIIAPETNGMLAHYCRLVREAGGRVLGPSAEFIELTSDKHQTAQWLRAHGVPAPAGLPIEAGQRLPADFTYPAVLKPRDGCGSQGVRRIDSAALARNVVPGTACRLERFCPGMPASVAMLCGPGVPMPLPPCEQTLSADGCFRYLGGVCPLPDAFFQRAVTLALRAISVLPPAHGYIGIDLVLGSADDGSQDYVIEVNPRLTTSYIGLRALCRNNLAEALLQTAEGQPPLLSWNNDPICFTTRSATHDRL